MITFYSKGAAHKFCTVTLVPTIVSLFLTTLPLPQLGHTSAVMLVCRKGNINRTVSVFSIVYHCNAAQCCEQFLKVSRLDRALIPLGLALYLPGTLYLWSSRCCYI